MLTGWCHPGHATRPQCTSEPARRSSRPPHPPLQRGPRRPGQSVRSAAEGDAAPAHGGLSATIKRKMRQLEARIGVLGTEALEEQLQTAMETRGATPDFRLTRLISATRASQGRPTVIMEVRRGGHVTSSRLLAEAAAAALAAGADAVAVPTDSEATPTGLADLFAVCQAVQAPVLCSDWMLHALQIVDAKEAGASGVLGIITSVTGNGTAVLSSFASALGLEAPVEIVNKQESDSVEQLGCPFVAVNLAVGLSLSMPSIATQIAEALVKDQPFGNLTLVGVRSFEELRSMHRAGADCMFLRADFVSEETVGQLPFRWTADSGISQQQAVLEEVIGILTE